MTVFMNSQNHAFRNINRLNIALLELIKFITYLHRVTLSYYIKIIPDTHT